MEGIRSGSRKRIHTHFLHVFQKSPKLEFDRKVLPCKLTWTAVSYSISTQCRLIFTKLTDTCFVIIIINEFDSSFFFFLAYRYLLKTREKNLCCINEGY